jgi:hypothetical protein
VVRDDGVDGQRPRPVVVDGEVAPWTNDQDGAGPDERDDEEGAPVGVQIGIPAVG